MEKFTVGITETLFRIVEIEAESHQEAIDKVQEIYSNGDIVLDSNDFLDVDFGIYEKQF